MKKKLWLGFIVLISLPSLAAEKRALYIGDSHSVMHNLNPSKESSKRIGNKVIERLRSLNYQVDYVAAAGASPKSWASGSVTRAGYTSYINGKFYSPPPRKVNGKWVYKKESYPAIDQVYNSSKHSLVVVNLGDNMLKRSGKVLSFNQSIFDDNMNRFLDKMKGVNKDNCRWVGPTYHKEGFAYKKTNATVDNLYRALKKRLKGVCNIIDSRPMVPANETGDGLHHSYAASRQWGEQVALQIRPATGENWVPESEDSSQ